MWCTRGRGRRSPLDRRRPSVILFKSRVSELCKSLDPRVADFRYRPLDGIVNVVTAIAIAAGDLLEAYRRHALGDPVGSARQIRISWWSKRTSTGKSVSRHWIRHSHAPSPRARRVRRFNEFAPNLPWKRPSRKRGGDGWESNPPRTPQQRPANGFEDRGRHQPPYIPSSDRARAWAPTTKVKPLRSGR
jgi:hypothetical protein